MARLAVAFERMLTTKKTGMGMGLIISRSIVEAHGGRICAENNSSLGGARFCVTLPVIARVKPAPDPAGAETPPAFASHRPPRAMRPARRSGSNIGSAIRLKKPLISIQDK